MNPDIGAVTHGGSAPDLSVVIPSVGGWSDLRHCLDALLHQGGEPRIEIIVVDRVGDAVRSEIRRLPHRIVVLEAPPGTTIPELRARGFQAARAQIVGVLEDHVLVPPDWSQRMLDAHRDGVEVVGGAIDNGARSRLAERAAFLCEYSHCLSPEAGPDGPVPGNNVTYRRRLLERFESTIEEGRWEDHLHAAMRREGVRMECRPDIRVLHDKHFTVREYVGQRYLYSRSYAGMRLRGAPAHRRLVHGLAAAALPAVLLRRIVHRTRVSGGESIRLLVAALPLLALFVTSWAAGEMVGSWFGPGDSLSNVR